MAKISDEQIKILFIETISGFYLNECTKNAGANSDEEGFLKNQLSEFMSGFRCAEKFYNNRETHNKSQTTTPGINIQNECRACKCR